LQQPCGSLLAPAAGTGLSQVSTVPASAFSRAREFRLRKDLIREKMRSA
jgi:hypothetical protein